MTVVTLREGLSNAAIALIGAALGALGTLGISIWQMRTLNILLTLRYSMRTLFDGRTCGVRLTANFLMPLKQYQADLMAVKYAKQDGTYSQLALRLDADGTNIFIAYNRIRLVGTPKATSIALEVAGALDNIDTSKSNDNEIAAEVNKAGDLLEGFIDEARKEVQVT